MWVQTLAPDGGIDPGDASRAGGQRGLLLLTNALEEESPDALPCSSSWHTQHAACDIASYAAIKNIPLRQTIFPCFRQKHQFGFILHSVQQLFPVK